MLETQHPVIQVRRSGIVLRNGFTKIEEHAKNVLVPSLESLDMLRQCPVWGGAAEKQFQDEFVARWLDVRWLGEPFLQLIAADGGQCVLLSRSSSALVSLDRHDTFVCHELFESGIDLAVALGPKEVEAFAEMFPQVIAGHRLNREQAKYRVSGRICGRHV